MSDDDGHSKVSVDIAAKAILKVQAEIPPESTGRALDALVDIIRPFTEARGLKADQLRLQRAEIAYEIAKIAKAEADLEKLSLIPPPTKFLVPFLERASLEDKDKQLHTRWASLLLSAPTHYDARHVTYIDILSRLSSEELLLLEDICLSDKMFPLTSYPDGHLLHNAMNAEKASFSFNVSDLTEGRRRAIFSQLLESQNMTYGRIMYASLGGTADRQVLYSEFGGPLQPKYHPLELLERERLLEFRQIRGTGAGAEIAYLSVTYLGVDFVRDCSPRGRNLVRRNKEHEISINP
jgi:hypothetical protein